MKPYLRNITKEDCLLLFTWLNNEGVRLNALDTRKISWKEHVDWFHFKLEDPLSIIYILEDINFPIGQIRYEKKRKFWLIDFSIDQKFRGMGFGKEIIELSLKNFSGTIQAKVKKENIASCKTFEKLGFEKTVKKDLVLYTITK